MPKLYVTYRMKEDYIDKTGFSFHVHVTKCGNRFRYLPKNRLGKNMECMGCGHTYHAFLHSFNSRYEEKNPILAAKDPNSLFGERKLQK